MQAANSTSHAGELLDSVGAVFQGRASSRTVRVEVKDTWHPMYKSLVCQAVRYLALNYTQQNGQIQSFEVYPQLVARIGIFQKDHPLELQEGLEFCGNGGVLYGKWDYFPSAECSSITEGYKQVGWGERYKAGLFHWLELPNQSFFSLKEGMLFDQDGCEFVGARKVIPELKTAGLTSGKHTHPSGLVEDGHWRYEPKIRNMAMVDGKVTQPDGTVEEGSWAFNDNLKKMTLQQGKCTHPNGKAEEGSWAYIKELGEMRLVFGQVTHALGITANGQFKFEPEMNDMALTHGRTELLGLVHQGTFGLEPEAEVNKPFLQEGSKIESGGAKQEGSWAYIPELRHMHLVDGVVKNKQGKVLLDGAWAYIPSDQGGNGGMVYTPRAEGAPSRKPLPEPAQWKLKPYTTYKGWVPSAEFKKQLTEGWLNVKNARIKDEWTLKVTRGHCPSGAGGAEAKLDLLRFEGPVRDIARAETQWEIARNMLKMQPKFTDDDVAKLCALPSWQVRLLRDGLPAQ